MNVNERMDTAIDDTAIGDAWLEDDGTVTLRLRRTADGATVDAYISYKTTDKEYLNVINHLGGLKKGEIVLIPAWPDPE